MLIPISYVNPIVAAVPRRFKNIIQEAVSYEASYWKQGPFGRERLDYRKNMVFMVTRKSCFFYLGHLRRVLDHIREKGYEFRLDALNWEFEISEPKLEGITFRDDQKFLMDTAISLQRGVILSPTGTGKTILQLGIISMLRGYRTLLLAHNVDILKQTYDEMKLRGFEDVDIMAGSLNKRALTDAMHILSSVQTLKKKDPSDYEGHFDAVLVDEAHHVSKPDGMYGEVLSNLQAPIRLGFTATWPDKADVAMALEGLIGRVIGEFTVEEAVEKKILADPIVRIIKVPFSNRIRDLRRYPEVYDSGIVYNQARNELISDTVKKYNKVGKSVLIMVTKIEHGNRLRRVLSETGVTAFFVKGDVKSQERENIKESFKKKDCLCVIATTVWSEGVNIPSLDVVINAAGGKSEIKALQVVGRGLRRTKEKEKVVLIDLFDPSHTFFVRHFGERFSLYCDMGWIK
jgi:superfamily II DNA or RNA helicase